MKAKLMKAELSDMEAILQLQYTAYQSEAELVGDYTIQPLTQTIDEITNEFNKGVILKAVINGTIIGSVRAYADDDTVYVGKLIVRPDHQGKGIGKRLLAAIESKIHRKRFELFTSSKNERNLGLYEKSGYKRCREETSEAGIIFVYMEKKYDDGSNAAYGMCFGMLAGVVVGTLTDNLGLWLPIGLCLGLTFGSLIKLNPKTK